MNKTDNFLKIVNIALFLVILLAGYTLLFIGAYFSHPNAEDFSLAGTARNEGIFISTMSLLLTYDGRYFTNVLHGLNPLAWNLLEYHKYMAMFSMLFFALAFYFFISIIFKPAKWYNNLLFSGLVLQMCLALSSSLVHELYWMVSSFVYFYSWIFWFLWVGSFLRFIVGVKYKLAYYFFSNLFLFLAIGINEMFLVLNVITVCYLIYLDVKKNKVSITYHIPIIITLLCSVLLFVSSPGILQRWKDFTPVKEDIGYWDILQNSVAHFSGEFLRLFAGNGVVIPVIFLIAAGLLNLKTIPFLKLNIKQQVVLFTLCIVTIYLMTWGFYIPAGRVETNFPHRVYTSIGTGVILCLTLFLPFFLGKIPKLNNQWISFLSLLIITMGLFLGNTNIRLIGDEYNADILRKHSEEMNKRYAIIEDARQHNDGSWKVAIIDTLSAKPNSIHYGPDIESNREPEYWNQAYERYFYVNEVRLMGDTIFKIN